MPEGQEKGTHPSGLPLLTAAQVADVHWDLFTKRDRPEAFAGDIEAVLKMKSGLKGF